jgi:hypothetical protein
MESFHVRPAPIIEGHDLRVCRQLNGYGIGCEKPGHMVDTLSLIMLNEDQLVLNLIQVCGQLHQPCCYVRLV